MRFQYLIAMCLLLLAGLLPAEGINHITWDDLVPDEFHPAKIMARHGVRFLDLSKPDDKVIFDEIEAARTKAPVVPDLDGGNVSISGFVVPLDGDGDATTEFLLVPDYGYCIHVPPPPSNQLVLVHAKNNTKAWRLFQEVEVQGILRVEQNNAGNGRSGYSLESSNIISTEG